MGEKRQNYIQALKLADQKTRLLLAVKVHEKLASRRERVSQYENISVDFLCATDKYLMDTKTNQADYVAVSRDEFVAGTQVPVDLF